MDQSTIATIVGVVSALITLGGVTGVTAQDVSGFLNTIFGLVALASFVWQHIAHRKALAAA